MKNNSRVFLVRLITDTAKNLYRIADSRLREIDLSLTEFRILKQLSEKGSLPMVTLAEGQFLTKPALTSIVDKMSKKKLVRRKRDKQDRRVVNVELTDLGKEMYEKCRSVVSGIAEDFFASATEEDVENLSSILKKILKTYENV